MVCANNLSFLESKENLFGKRFSYKIKAIVLATPYFTTNK